MAIDETGPNQQTDQQTRDTQKNNYTARDHKFEDDKDHTGQKPIDQHVVSALITGMSMLSAVAWKECPTEYPICRGN